jgi:hypothetical protein
MLRTDLAYLVIVRVEPGGRCTARLLEQPAQFRRNLQVEPPESRPRQNHGQHSDGD